jgi:hypothetical protein
VKQTKKLNVNQFVWLNALVFAGLLSSVFYTSPFIKFTILLLSIFAISGVMPTEYSNLRIVYAFTYNALGFALYLVLRGFIGLGPISRYDFAVCIFLLSFVATIPKILSRKTEGVNFKPLKFSFVAGSATLVFCLAFGVHLMSKGIGFFLAWSASGDSRNHIQVIFLIARKGYLDLIDFGSPLLPHTIAVFLGSGSPVGLGNDSSPRLLTDLTSYALTWALLISILGYAFAAVWEVVLPKTTKNTVFFLLAPASLLALTSLALGTFLLDGFVTATAGAIVIAFAISILLERSKKTSNTNLFTLVLIVIFATFSWTFVVIPVLIMMIPLYFKWLDFASKSLWMWLRLGLTFFGIFAVWYRFTTYYADYFLLALGADGSISAAHPKTFKILLLSILVLASLRSKKVTPTFLQLGLVVLSATSLILILNKASGIPLNDLNYYSTKAMMILFVGLLPLVLIFIPIVIHIVILKSPFSPLRMVIVSGLITTLTFSVAQYISPYPRILGQINDGWQGPSAKTLSMVLPLANDPLNPVVFFDYLPSESGENRLANFWLGVYAEPWAYYQSWAYFGDQSGDYPAFCYLNRGYPVMTVYTKDEKLRTNLRANCRNEVVVINLIK